MRFVFDESNNRHEALDKEGVEALLAQAIQSGKLPSVDEDTAFVTMLKDPITGVSHKIVMCTQAKYNEMERDEALIANAYYFITDDTTADELEAHLVRNDERVSALEEEVREFLAETSEVVFHDLGEVADFQSGMDAVSAFYSSLESKRQSTLATFHLSTSDSEHSFIVFSFANYGGTEYAKVLSPTGEISFYEKADYLWNSKVSLDFDVKTLKANVSDLRTRTSALEADTPSVLWESGDDVTTYPTIASAGVYLCEISGTGGKMTSLVSVSDLGTSSYGTDAKTAYDAQNSYFAFYDSSEKKIYARSQIHGDHAFCSKIVLMHKY